MAKKKQENIKEAEQIVNYEDEERVAAYPTEMAHGPYCSREPEWEFEFESRERYFWLCLGCGYEVQTDINGKTLARDERL